MLTTTENGSGPVANRGPVVRGVTAVTFLLTLLFVVARLFTRLAIVGKMGWDDHFILVAAGLGLAISFTINYGIGKGLGRHDSDIAFSDWDSFPALMATKASILIFYLRLAKNTKPVLRLASWAVLATQNLAGTVLTLINIFQCRPIWAAYSPYPPNGPAAECIPLLTEFLCAAPVNIVTDLAILALPLPVLTRMRLPPRQKLILVLTFGLGVFVTVVGVVRVYYLQQAITSVSPAMSDSPDASFGDEAEFAWNASLSLMWSAVEVNVGIICACIPTLKPLIIRVLPSMLMDPHGSRRRLGTSDEASTSLACDYNSNAQAGRLSQNVAVLRLANAASPDHVWSEPTSPPSEPSEPQRSHLQPVRAGSSPDSGVALDFITTPDMNQTRARRTSAALSSNGRNTMYFGFVKLRRPKSLIRTSARASWKYCTVVTILFVLWGFSYGLLNTLNGAIASVAGMSTAETLGLTSMYFGAGYLLGPLLVGEWLLRHDEHRRSRKHDGSQTVGGFKATFMSGLCIYGVGTIMFWPCAVLLSFPGFMISTFVVGFGLAVLETAANPFLALCGPMDYSEMRLLLAQGVQAVSTVLSQLLAEKVLFHEIGSSRDSMTLLEVQWTYLAITLSCAALTLLFYYMPLPEVTDLDMDKATRYLPLDPDKASIGRFELRTWTLALAVLAQWTYVGGQECMSIFFSGLMASDDSQFDIRTSSRTASAMSLRLAVPDYLVISRTAFAVSRLLAAYLAYLSPHKARVPQPRTMLSISLGLSIAFAIMVVVYRPAKADLRVIPIVLFFFAEGPIWPLIFCLGLRGQGRRTKRAAAWITVGASGPAFWPFVIHAIRQAGSSYQLAFVVVPSLLVVSALFPAFLHVKKDARALVDARIGPEEQSKLQNGVGAHDDDDRHWNDVMDARRRFRTRADAKQEKWLGRISDAIQRSRRRSRAGKVLYSRDAEPSVERRMHAAKAASD